MRLSIIPDFDTENNLSRPLNWYFDISRLFSVVWTRSRLDREQYPRELINVGQFGDGEVEASAKIKQCVELNKLKEISIK